MKNLEYPSLLEITIQNEKFSLHPSGAVCWHSKNMLLIADVHFGKVAHFRKHGAAVPARASEKNFKKLDLLIEECQPQTICFLGDLFHSTLNNDWAKFEKWVAKTNLEIILIAGNHDIISPHKFEALGIRVIDSLIFDKFLLTHHPTEDKTHFNFAGHVHPGIRLQGIGKQFMKLPCFFKTKKQMILPAFGNFTGKYILKPQENDEVFAIADGEVICVS